MRSNTNKNEEEQQIRAELDLDTTSNSSFSRWTAIDDDLIPYPIKDETALINKCPNETWVECMRFLNRDNLQTLQLVANKFDLMVEKYFGVYPLRRVNRCKVRTNKRKKSMEILLICLTTDKEPGRTIETNSDLYLWLQHCFVDCIEFINFHFSFQFLLDLQQIDQRLMTINYCVFDYDKRSIEVPVTEDHILSLFGIEAFRKCFGAVFSFDKRCSTFRPKIKVLLKLPQKNLVIDFVNYTPTADDYTAISRCLNGITANEENRFGQLGDANKALSLRDFKLDINSLENLINILQTDFLRSSRKHHFIMDAHWDENWDLPWQLEERDLTRTIVNKMTNEKFIVKTDGKLSIIRE